MPNKEFPIWRYDPLNYQQNGGGFYGLQNRQGEIRFKMVPGSDEASANGMYIFHAVNTGAPSLHYIKLYFSANNTAKLEYKELRGTARSGTWDATGALAHDGTAYDVRIRYDKTWMKLYIDNVLKITISSDVNFGTAVPNHFTLGTDIDGANAYTSTTFTKPTENIYWHRAIQGAG